MDPAVIKPRGFYVLNVLRICSIISLLSSIVAATAALIKSFEASKFFFFDATNHVLLSAICIFLILSECSLARPYFQTSWPLFASNAPLLWLGLAETSVGAVLLGNLNEDFATEENLGTAFNTLLLASGRNVILMGVFAVIANFVYRKGTKVTARDVRSFRGMKQRKLEASKIGNFVVAAPPPPPPRWEQPAAWLQVPQRARSRRMRSRDEESSIEKESLSSSRYSETFERHDAEGIAEMYKRAAGLYTNPV